MMVSSIHFSNGTTIGLISGGKDSLFALHCCYHFGYKIEVIGHIRHSILENEADSYMYQTVGSHLIESIAQCLNLPLIVKELSGFPKSTDSLEYSQTEGDEVEDLYELLKIAKEQFTNLRFVCTGAILSDYQRHRVESACVRLGLISLAFLWKFQQGPLLDLICSTPDFEARIIKVASMGLDGSELGKDLRELKEKFHKLESQFGFHSCGEGGEFESTTLNSPLFINERIQVDDWSYVIHSDDAFAPVIYIYPKNVSSIQIIKKIINPLTDRSTTLNSNDVSTDRVKFPPFSIVDDLSFYFMDVLGSSLNSFIEFISNSNAAFKWSSTSLEELTNFDALIKSIPIEWEKLEELIIKTFPSWKILSTTSSVSLWRPYDLNQLPNGLILPDYKLLITNWLTPLVPHHCNPPLDLYQQSDEKYLMKIFISQLTFAIRNLRNFLFDQKLGLQHVRRIELLVISEHDLGGHQKASLESKPDWIRNVLGQIWLRNFGEPEKDANEAHCLCQQREAQIWRGQFLEIFEPFDRIVELPIECRLIFTKTLLHKNQQVHLRCITSTE